MAVNAVNGYSPSSLQLLLPAGAAVKPADTGNAASVLTEAYRLELSGMQPAPDKTGNPSQYGFLRYASAFANGQQTLSLLSQPDAGTAAGTGPSLPAAAQSLKEDAFSRYLGVMNTVAGLLGIDPSVSSADDIMSALIKNRATLSVPESVRQQAAADIAPGGYWSAESTAGRLLDFAKALGGDDPEKIALLKKGFEDGYNQVAKLFGGADKMLDISKQTYALVQKGFADWEQEVSSRKQQAAQAGAA
ncbi:MAG: hypothetical protein N3A57_03610 [Negativicutes bacterium]|nr:hypothetical protein [Negativicutes bacterium]